MQDDAEIEGEEEGRTTGAGGATGGESGAHTTGAGGTTGSDFEEPGGTDVDEPASAGEDTADYAGDRDPGSVSGGGEVY